MLDTRIGSYSLAASATTVDSSEFLELAAAGRSHLAQGDPVAAAETLRRALDVWRGPALAEFEHLDFATAERVRLTESRVAAREDLLEAELAAGLHDRVIADAEAALVEHPLRERVWAQLMLALYRADRQADALRAFQRAREVLAEELGLDPGPALRDLERRMLDHDPDLLLAPRPVAPAAPVRGATLSNVRPALSSFIGRADELSATSDLVTRRRLVTIIGPGGVGKTRLVTEVAVASTDHWAGGAWFVDLGFEAGEGAVHRAMIRTFGHRLGRAGSHTLDWLVAGRGTTPVLVVLDNCEHVLGEVAPLVEAVLQRCPSVHVLATSREPLGCEGELVRRLEPLPLDDAIALFTSRAADSSVDLGGDEETVDAVHAICRQLDRLPLAIELTAARTRVFSAPRLAALLQERSALVSTDSSARPQRQQTLAAAVDWSYDLLFEAEQRLLCRLSVFVDGFTLDAAIAVCADDDLPAEEVGLLLARLVDKSLVTPVHGPGRGERFTLLRPVAEFAARRLEPTGETHELRRRHTAWLVELTMPLMSALRGPQALQWADVVTAELENASSAARWSLRDGDPGDGLRIAVNLGWYAFLSANVHDDHSLIVAALERATDAPAALRCRGMMWAGLLSIGHTDGRAWAMDAIDVARTAGGLADSREGREPQRRGLDRTAAAIELARAGDDPVVLMEALCFGALHFAAVGHAPELVVSLAAELASLARLHGEDWYVAFSLGLQGLAAYVTRDLRRASANYAECILEFERLGDAGTAAMFGISASETAEFVGDLSGAISSVEPAFALGSTVGFRSSTILGSVLCWLASRNGETERALQLGGDALSAVRRPFNPVIRAQALFALGAAEERAGSLELAEEHLAEALSIHRQVGMVRETAMDHRHLGFVHRSRGDRAAAREHFERGARLASEVGLPWTMMLTTRSFAAGVVDDDVELACRLIGVADHIAAHFGYAATVDDQADVDDVIERSAAAVGSRLVSGWRKEGAARGIDGLRQLLDH
jgi:predicted ATPase/tetratricopeptide (TPR) repeat protein